MPIATNRFYNDPGLGQAFSSLAQAFAPPSGSDLAGYATAREKNLHSDAYLKATSTYSDPNATDEQRDAAGVLANLFVPTQSYRALKMNNATTRYGDDQRLLGTKYTADTAARTDLDRTRMTNQKDVTTALLTPVAEGATRFVPSSIADVYSLEPTQVGTIKAGQGDTVTTADGRTFAGTPKPLTEEQIRGAILQKLPEADQRNAALSGVNVEQAIVGGKPVYVNRPEAAGKPVYSKPADVKNYRTSEGVQGTASIGADGKLYDTQNGSVVPQSAVVFGTNINGTPGDFSKIPEWQAKGKLAAMELEKPINRLANQIETGKLPVSTKDVFLNSMTSPGTAPITVPMMSPDAQQAFNDLRSVTQTYLFLKSGANVPETEVNRELLNTMPYAGEAPDVTKIKLQTMRDRLSFIRDYGGMQQPSTADRKPNAGAQSQTPDPLAAARDAISRGADRNAVIQRLQDHGINPGGL